MTFKPAYAFFLYTLALIAGLAILSFRIDKSGFARTPKTYQLANFEVTLPVAVLDYDKLQYKTNRDLEPNHRIVQRDLQPPLGIKGYLARSLLAEKDLIGKDVKKRIDSGTPIRTENLQALPTIYPIPGTRVHFLPLSEELSTTELLDVNQKVDLYLHAQCLVKGATILALVCEKKVSSSCLVALEIPQSEIKKLLGVPDNRRIRLLTDSTVS